MQVFYVLVHKSCASGQLYKLQLCCSWFPYFWMNCCMLVVYPNPGIMSAQKSITTARNCDNDVQNRTDTKLAWDWPLFSPILTAFSSNIKEMAEIPFKKQNKAQFRLKSSTAVWGHKPALIPQGSKSWTHKSSGNLAKKTPEEKKKNLLNTLVI